MIVIAFGTSLTYRAGWLRPLQNELTRCIGLEAAVLDFGHSGATSEWGLANVSKVISLSPDVVLIEFAINDAALLKGVTLRRSQDNITRIVRTIKEAIPHAKIFLMMMNPVFGPRAWIRPRMDAYYDLYKIIAGDLAVRFIDNRDGWKKLSKELLLSGIPDGTHPLPELAAQIVVPSVLRAIIDGRCR